MHNSKEIFNFYTSKIQNKLSYLAQKYNNISAYTLYGKVLSAKGTNIIAYLPTAKVGDLCEITDLREFNIKAEVVAINGHNAVLIPFSYIHNVSQNCYIYKKNEWFSIKLNNDLLGSIVNGLGEFQFRINNNEKKDQTSIDTNLTQQRDIMAKAPDPLQRPIIDKQLLTNINAIDLFIPCGIGQRLGVFAPPGVGKTTLMGMLIRNVEADVVVIALIGERGREVREFIDLELDEGILSRCVVVVSTSDKPPVEQVKAAYVAQTIAEYFRDQGKNVVLFMDSITRFARAGREIGLSAGEPITRGGFPPSVFLSFPQLMERAGTTPNGSITAFYMVLTDISQNNSDAIAEEIKSISDGHIMLSRDLANRGHYPAIDVLTSLSRIGDRLITQKQLLATRHLRLLLTEHNEIEFLLKVGEYVAGQNKLADEAIAKYDDIIKFLQQPPREILDLTADKKFSQLLNQLYTLTENS